MFVRVCRFSYTRLRQVPRTYREIDRQGKEKERKKEENERASEQVCSNKEKSGKKGERREKGVDGASTRQSRASWPPCFKMSSAFVYQGKFAPTIGQIAQKGDLFSVSYLRSLSPVSVRFFFVVHRLVFLFLPFAYLSLPLHLFFAIVRSYRGVLSVQLSLLLTKFHAFALPSRPLSVSLSLSLSLSLSHGWAYFLKEGTRVSTFRQFIFCTELERSQSAFLWSRASGNAVTTRTAILR